MGELTPDERIAWAEIISSEEMQLLDAEMARIVRLDEITTQAIADAVDEIDPDDDQYVWLEIPIPFAEAESVYEAWWAYAAGNLAAWADLEEPVSQMFDALGLELYGDVGEVEE